MDQVEYTHFADSILSIRCPRTFSATFQQHGVTVTAMTNNTNQAAFLLNCKTDLGLLELRSTIKSSDVNLVFVPNLTIPNFSLILHPITGNFVSEAEYATKLGKICYKIDTLAKLSKCLYGNNFSAFDYNVNFNVGMENKIPCFNAKVFNSRFSSLLRYNYLNNFVSFSMFYRVGSFLKIINAIHVGISTKSTNFECEEISIYHKSEFNSFDLSNIVTTTKNNVKISTRIAKLINTQTLDAKFATEFSYSSGSFSGIVGTKFTYKNMPTIAFNINTKGDTNFTTSVNVTKNLKIDAGAALTKSTSEPNEIIPKFSFNVVLKDQ